MAYNNTTNIDQAPGAGLPAGGKSIPPGATRDFQPMGTQSSSVNLLPHPVSLHPVSHEHPNPFLFLLLIARS